MRLFQNIYDFLIGPSYKTDPIEKDRKIRKIINKARREAGKEIKETMPNIIGRMGNCHAYWTITKRILKEKYNIDWKTPAEMNPDIRFD